MLQSAIQTCPMTLIYIQQVKSNRAKLIDFISDGGCDCSSSWHYSMNAAKQHRTLIDRKVLLFKIGEARDIIGL